MGYKNGGLVLRTGKCLVQFTRWLLWMILAGAGLFVISSILVAALDLRNFSQYLKLAGGIGMMNFLLGGSYLLLILGVCDGILYFLGIHFVGLGQLVLNTCQARQVPSETEEEPVLEELPSAPETPVEEEIPKETEEEIPEDEEENWRAILERDDALMPGVKTAAELVEELPPPGKSGRWVSPAFLNILRYALSNESDKQVAQALYNGLNRLTKAHERNLIGHILHAPDGNIREAADQVYHAICQKK